MMWMRYGNKKTQSLECDDNLDLLRAKGAMVYHTGTRASPPLLRFLLADA